MIGQGGWDQILNFLTRERQGVKEIQGSLIFLILIGIRLDAALTLDTAWFFTNFTISDLKKSLRGLCRLGTGDSRRTFFTGQYPSQYTTISFIVLSGYLVTVIVTTFVRRGASQSRNQLRSAWSTSDFSVQCIDLPSPGDITVAGECDTYIALCNLQCNGWDRISH